MKHDLNENIVIKGARVNNLKNVSITIPRNKLVVFTGLSGSGKSSLVGLIPRFYDATRGEVLVYGENVNNYNIEELRS
ncbi:MAG: ATP-binding cassette domain-containing protein, partial [Clostridia bacterium]|nr:ATP-binding cassette domain-containing protein [Clostridia bacterium]